MEFKVVVENGNVFINGKFVDQLCFDSYAIGSAVTRYLEGDEIDAASENAIMRVREVPNPSLKKSKTHVVSNKLSKEEADNLLQEAAKSPENVDVARKLKESANLRKIRY